MSEEKRGRGRPKGSLNKTTLAKQGAMKEATTLDVSFEEPEIVPEAEPSPEPEPEPEIVPETEEPEVEPEPVKKRAPRKPKVPVEEEEPVKKRAPRKKIPVESSDDDVQLQPPPPKKTRAPKPRVASSETLQEEPLTYLQVLQRSLLSARASDKANKVAWYDAYFAQLH